MKDRERDVEKFLGNEIKKLADCIIKLNIE